MANYNPIEVALKAFLQALIELRSLNIITNKKDFTCQIGEWLVAILYEGERAKSGNQKHWDIQFDNKLCQVKSHAKAATNKTRWSAIRHDPHAEIDELIIIVFTNGYKLTSFYKLPWKLALPMIKRGDKKDIIYWDDLRGFQISIDNLPKQDLITLFR